MEGETYDHTQCQTIDQEMSKKLTSSFDQVDDGNNDRPSHAMKNDLHDSNYGTSKGNHNLNEYLLPRNE